jgi:hypothetical protein
MSFLKGLLPDLKKDIVKDAVKYALVSLGTALLLWLGKQVKPVGIFLERKLSISVI